MNSSVSSQPRSLFLFGSNLSTPLIILCSVYRCSYCCCFYCCCCFCCCCCRCCRCCSCCFHLACITLASCLLPPTPMLHVSHRFRLANRLPLRSPPISPFPRAPCPFHSCASRCALIYPLTKRSTVAPPLAAPRTPLANSFAYHLRASCEVVAATRCSSDCFSSFTPSPAPPPFCHPFPFAFPLAVKCITMNYVGAPSGHPAVTRK